MAARKPAAKPAAKSEMYNHYFNGPIELALTDRQAVARNAAENGRLFCVGLALVALVLGASWLAIFSILPLGVAAVVDPMPAGRLRSALVPVVYGLPAVVAGALVVISILKVW